LKSWLSNCRPWSVVIVAGTPKRLIQWVSSALETVSASMLEVGITSGHLEVRSTIVIQYVWPREGGSGPTISRWT